MLLHIEVLEGIIAHGFLPVDELFVALVKCRLQLVMLRLHSHVLSLKLDALGLAELQVGSHLLYLLFDTLVKLVNHFFKVGQNLFDLLFLGAHVPRELRWELSDDVRSEAVFPIVLQE